MRTFKTLLASAFILTAIVSCDEKEPDNLITGEPVDQIELNVSFNTASLDDLWTEGWETRLQYDWDESDSTYGALGYPEPENIKGTIFNIDYKTGDRINHFFKVFALKDSTHSFQSAVKYDMLFYNFGTNLITFYQSDDYKTYTAQGDLLGRTGELQGAFLKGVEFPPYQSSKLEVDLEPYTYIYLLQIIIKNNQDNRITGADALTLTGLAKGTSLFTRTTFTDTVSITTQDIKPLQNHREVSLEDGTTLQQAGILAARILTWGLPANSAATDRNDLSITLTLQNGQTKTLTRDITTQLRQNSKGGVITVCLDAENLL
ncbi:MAG: hypothetical protein IKX55_01600 [Bacteroidaceae bacterium]|nr:hypothetical protein [Bacteroidaceae bacterium]